MTLDRTWFNALVDDDGSNTVGTVWNKAQINALLNSVDAEFAKVSGAGGGVYGSAPASIPHGSVITMPLETWNTEDFMTPGFWSTSLQHFVIPTGQAGLYHIQAAVNWANHATGIRAIYLAVNGAVVAQSVVAGMDSAGTGPGQSVAVYAPLADGAAVTVKVYQNSGAALPIAVPQLGAGPRFQLVRVR